MTVTKTKKSREEDKADDEEDRKEKGEGSRTSSILKALKQQRQETKKREEKKKDEQASKGCKVIFPSKRPSLLDLIFILLVLFSYYLSTHLKNLRVCQVLLV